MGSHTHLCMHRCNVQTGLRLWWITWQVKAIVARTRRPPFFEPPSPPRDGSRLDTNELERLMLLHQSSDDSGDHIGGRCDGDDVLSTDDVFTATKDLTRKVFARFPLSMPLDPIWQLFSFEPPGDMDPGYLVACQTIQISVEPLYDRMEAMIVKLHETFKKPTAHITYRIPPEPITQRGNVEGCESKADTVVRLS